MIAISTAFKDAIIVYDNGKNVITKVFNSSAKHSETLLLQFEEILGERKVTSLTRIGVVVGPGSFTGIRIGVSLVLGFMAVSKNLEAVPVSALDFIAKCHLKNSPKADFYAVINALSGMFFVCRYDKNGSKISEERLIELSEFEEIKNQTVGLLEEGVAEKLIVPDPLVLLELTREGKPVDANSLRPVYLRLSQAEANLVTLERATEEDANAIFEISACRLHECWSREMIKETIKNPNNYCVCLKKGGKLIGFLNALQTADEFEILNIAVSQGRRGYGKILLNNLEERAKEGGKKIFLEVSEANSSALAFYLKNNFVKIGERKKYYADGSNAILMEKKI